MACEAQRFSAVDSERWSCMKDGEPGWLSFTWSYNAGEQTLSVQCTDSPFWAPCSVITTGCKASRETAESD
jgi:hypothetical protein